VERTSEVTARSEDCRASCGRRNRLLEIDLQENGSASAHTIVRLYGRRKELKCGDVERQ